MKNMFDIFKSSPKYYHGSRNKSSWRSGKPASDVIITKPGLDKKEIIPQEIFGTQKDKLSNYRNRLRINATPEEILVLKKLKISLGKTKLPCSVSFQHIISKYIIDMYITKARLAIEIDGNHHQSDPLQKSKDIKRDKFLSKNNIQVLRFSNKKVKEDVRTVVNSIMSAIVLRLGGICPAESYSSPPEKDNQTEQT